MAPHVFERRFVSIKSHACIQELHRDRALMRRGERGPLFSPSKRQEIRHACIHPPEDRSTAERSAWHEVPFADLVDHLVVPSHGTYFAPLLPQSSDSLRDGHSRVGTNDPNAVKGETVDQILEEGAGEDHVVDERHFLIGELSHDLTDCFCQILQTPRPRTIPRITPVPGDDTSDIQINPGRSVHSVETHDGQLLACEQERQSFAEFVLGNPVTAPEIFVENSLAILTKFPQTFGRQRLGGVTRPNETEIRRDNVRCIHGFSFALNSSLQPL